MIRRYRPDKTPWQKLASGLYVPPVLGFAGQPYPCSPPCEEEGWDCPECGDDTAPQQIQIVVSDFSPWNGTYILTQCNKCVWVYYFDEPISDKYGWALGVQNSGPPRFFVQWAIHLLPYSQGVFDPCDYDLIYTVLSSYGPTRFYWPIYPPGCHWAGTGWIPISDGLCAVTVL